MNGLRALLLLSLVVPLSSGCGDKCVRKGSTLKCPDGYVGYGRRTPNRNKDWLPIFALEDLAAWATEGSYKNAGSCEMACVPAALGEPDQLATCDAWQPCGGDLNGDWRWDAYACPYDVPQTLQGNCATGAQAETARNEGTLSFEDDGTVAHTAQNAEQSETVHLPAECLDNFTDCADLLLGDSCTGDPAEGCTCTGSSGTGAQSWDGTWTKAGTTVEIERDGQTYAVEYCVDGDQLILEWPADDDLVRVREHLFKWEN